MSWSHRLATLEPSSSFTTIRPINDSTTEHTSTFERRLAKYSSLPLLWLRTCGSSNQQQHQQQKRRTIVDESIGKEILQTSFGQFGEFFET